jgi:predicted phage-related endonuclease
MFQHPDYDFMMANIDFGILGENAGLECKNSAARKLWEHGVPESYIVQVQHYMAVTNMDRWYIAYLLDGWQFNYVCIERDDALINLLIQKEWELWNNHIIPRIPPEYDGSDNARKVLAALYPGERTGETIDLDAEIDDWMERVESLDSRLKEMEFEKKTIMHKICGLIGECEIGYTPGHIIKYKTVAPEGKKSYRRLFITSRKEA